MSSQFAEAVFASTRRAQLIGADAFDKTGHTHCAAYLWTALETHRVLQDYIELGFTAHPEVSSVVVDHLIHAHVPMAMHNAAILEVKDLATKVKTASATVNKLE
jgi:hypothetical protein